MYNFLTIVAAITLAGCSGSGVGSGAGGAPGTDTGKTGLLVYATITPDTFSSDTHPSDCDGDGEVEQSIHSDLGKIRITLQDKASSDLFQQGVTFNSYVLAYTPVSASAPRLTPRTQYLTIPMALDGKKEVTAEAQIVLVELDTTKREFARANSTGKPYTYSIHVTFYGRDWVNNDSIKLVTNTQMELGNFCEK